MLVEMIEKQIFLINLENMDIAEVMFEQEDQEDQEEDYDEELEDSLHLKELLEYEKLELSKLDDSKAIVSYKNRILSIKLEENNTKYKLSMLEFHDYKKYKK